MKRKNLLAIFCLVVPAAIFFNSVPVFAENMNYSYDVMLRLTRVQYDNGSSVNYLYDNMGNRLIKKTLSPTTPVNHPPNVAFNPSPANNGARRLEYHPFCKI